MSDEKKYDDGGMMSDMTLRDHYVGLVAAAMLGFKEGFVAIKEAAVGRNIGVGEATALAASDIADAMIREKRRRESND